MPDYVSNKTIDKLKYDLVRNNLISYEDLTAAEELSVSREHSLVQILTQEGFISEDALLNYVQDNLHIPYVSLENYTLDKRCIPLISGEEAYKYRILPLFKIENVLTLAMADPLDLFALNNVLKSMQCDIEPVICSEEVLLGQIKRYYSGSESSYAVSRKGSGITVDWREELNEESPDMKQAGCIINAIISQALAEGVYEIILESTGRGLFVKFRKAGVYQAGELHEKGEIPILLSSLCIAQVKELSKLDSSVFNVPQLGKFRFSADIKSVTGIVSTFPSTKGERITIKLYHPPKTVHELDLSEEKKGIILESLEKPGIILVTGGELSGKSFIAYSMLNSINSTGKNIMTVESVVKYELSGVNQCELNEKVGLSTEKALKMIGFQSPDVVYIEEIAADSLLALADGRKVVIAEMVGLNITEELKKALNCMVTIKNTGEIEVKRP